MALQKYIDRPENFKNDSVLFSDENVTIIFDAFPKSKVHLLVLPRDKSKTLVHPLVAFQDKDFKQLIDGYVYDVGRKLAIEELQKTMLTESVEKMQEQKGEGGGSDYWLQQPEQLKIGVHSVPSMANLHVHIMSTDFCGTNIKNRGHYNSFNTKFFVPYSELPLEDKGDVRYDAEKMSLVVQKTELICLHCRKNFGNKFAQLKTHLQNEDKHRSQSAISKGKITDGGLFSNSG